MNNGRKRKRSVFKTPEPIVKQPQQQPPQPQKQTQQDNPPLKKHKIIQEKIGNIQNNILNLQHNLSIQLRLEEFLNSYFYSKSVGSGGYGDVRKVNINGTDYAVKRGDYNRESEYQSINNVKIRESIESPYILKTFGFINVKGHGRFSIMEYLDEKWETLKEFNKRIQDNPNRAAIREAICEKLKKALEEVHKLKFYHQDLKLENIMIKFENMDLENIELKFIDYDHCCIGNDGHVSSNNGYTTFYSNPINFHPSDKLKLNDDFALHMTCIFLKNPELENYFWLNLHWLKNYYRFTIFDDRLLQHLGKFIEYIILYFVVHNNIKNLPSFAMFIYPVFINTEIIKKFRKEFQDTIFLNPNYITYKVLETYNTKIVSQIDNNVLKRKVEGSFSFNVNDFLNHFATSNILGTGAYGEVRKVNINGTYYAVKYIRTQEKLQNQIYNNIHIGRTPTLANSPYLLKTYGWLSVEGTGYFSIMEYLDKSWKTLKTFNIHSLEQQNSICSKLKEAVESIHQSGFYHLDIKPDNIMINTNTDIKFIDYGASVWHKEMTNDVLSVKYYFPFVLKDEMETWKYRDLFAVHMVCIFIKNNKDFFGPINEFIGKPENVKMKYQYLVQLYKILLKILMSKPSTINTESVSEILDTYETPEKFKNFLKNNILVIIIFIQEFAGTDFVNLKEKIINI